MGEWEKGARAGIRNASHVGGSDCTWENEKDLISRGFLDISFLSFPSSTHHLSWLRAQTQTFTRLFSRRCFQKKEHSRAKRAPGCIRQCLVRRMLTKVTVVSALLLFYVFCILTSIKSGICSRRNMTILRTTT